MNQLLCQAIRELGVEFTLAGNAIIIYKEPDHINGSFLIYLDYKRFVGGVCFWPDPHFEFHDRDTGRWRC